MAMASSSGTRCEINMEVDSPNRTIMPLDFNGECLESGDGAQQEIKVRGEGVAARRSCSKLFRYFGGCCSAAGFSLERSWYYSERIQRMIEKGGEFKSDVESQIESSKIHWSQVEATKLEREQTRKINREYFEVLKRRKYVWEGDQLVAMQCIDEYDVNRINMFNNEWDQLEVDEKVAEGGQAEIYTVKGRPDVVLKVFKEGSVLQELEKQWPLALLKLHQVDYLESIASLLFLSVLGVDSQGFVRQVRGATLARSERLGWEDRFAFFMPRYWGDLRTLIDQRMIQSHNQGPPFTPLEIRYVMRCMAWQMMLLHGQHPPILHNDLKAANVLVRGKVGKDGRVKLQVKEDGMYDILVVDYECSVGVVGTGYWRAPEILQQLKHKVLGSKLVFSEKCDVYSYGMTCYELVSGSIPFEDYQNQPNEGSELVLKGERPELPPGLNRMIKKIITSCWKEDPLERPSFEEILQMIKV